MSSQTEKQGDRVLIPDRIYDCEYERVADLCRILDEGGVPNMLYGDYMYSCIGATFDRGEGTLALEIMVPSELIVRAGKLLIDAVYGKPPPWADNPDLGPVFPMWLPRILPTSHYYPDRPDQYCRHLTQVIVETNGQMWTCPEIPIGAPPADDPFFTTIRDGYLPQTSFCTLHEVHSDLYPVKIPKPSRILEHAMWRFKIQPGYDGYRVFERLARVKHLNIFKESEVRREVRPYFKLFMKGELTQKDLKSLRRDLMDEYSEYIKSEISRLDRMIKDRDLENEKSPH